MPVFTVIRRIFAVLSVSEDFGLNYDNAYKRFSAPLALRSQVKLSCCQNSLSQQPSEPNNRPNGGKNGEMNANQKKFEKI